MKFKSIFILFSIVLVFFLALLVLLPFFMLGPSLSESFWRINWPLIVVLIVLIVGFNIFYFINRRLFMLLEKEDWPALARYLEDKVIQKGRYSPRLVKLLANTYLVLSDSQGVMSLENKVAIVKPSLVNANVLIFGASRILGKDISGAIRFFQTRKATVKPALRDWVTWYHGFALLLDRQYEEAGEEFSILANVCKDGVITALSSYFLDKIISPATGERSIKYKEFSAKGKERVLKSLPTRKHWNHEVSRLSTEIHAAALFKYMEETGRWLFS